MSRRKLKNTEPRKKAMFGVGEAAIAAATLAAAAMNVAATNSAAKKQAKSVEDSAKTQASALQAQNANNNALQKESIAFTSQQNQENRNQQQDIQMTLQQLAGQQNMNDRLEAQKKMVKLGGSVSKPSIKSKLSYGGGDIPFTVTDGGGAIPLQVDSNGYGLYELYGNDHEHYHKAQGGKNKTGVGIKLKNGGTVEGEGNQNTNLGELMYVTPDDALFLSKHSMDGFNPAKAVLAGVHPRKAFKIQETIKDIKGYNDDGTMAKCGKRISTKKTFGGANILMNNANITQSYPNITAPVAGGSAYVVNQDKTTSPVAKCGKRISMKKCGGRIKAASGTRVSSTGSSYTPTKISTTGTYSKVMNTDFRGSNKSSSSSSTQNATSSPYLGAAIFAGANLLGAGLSFFGNRYASRKLADAYNRAGETIADAYSRMKGIDMNAIKKEDYEAPHALAVIRDANTNINPQIERLRRNASAETREVERGTMSSAARQQRLAGINDRMLQRMSEQYAYKHNVDERIKQGNAARITQVAQDNANRDVQARKDYTGARLALLQYNNYIENAKIAGIAQAQSDAMTQSAGAKASAAQASMNTFANSLVTGAKGFADTYRDLRNADETFANAFVGLGDASQVTAALTRGDKKYVLSLWDKHNVYNPTPADINALDSLESWLDKNNIPHTRRK